MATFSQRLKELRKEKGLTQKELAEKVGTQQGVYTNWENGKREPKYDKVGELANELNTTSYYLLGFTDEKTILLPAYRLKEIRTEKGLTIEQLSNIINVKKDLYEKWEKGEKFPSFFALNKLSKALGIRGEYLIGVDNFKTDNSRTIFENEKVKKDFYNEIKNIKNSKDEDIVIRKLNNIFSSLMQAAKEVGERHYYEEAFDFIFKSFDEINEPMSHKK